MYGESGSFLCSVSPGRLEQNLAKLSDVVVDRSDLLLNVCASTGLVAMDKIQVQTPKGRCEKLQSVDPARRGRSNVSLIYLLQRPRVSPNSVRGALVKLSTKKNRFPHTFSKAPCSGMQLFRTSRGRVQPPLCQTLVRAFLRPLISNSSRVRRKGLGTRLGSERQVQLHLMPTFICYCHSNAQTQWPRWGRTTTRSSEPIAAHLTLI